MNINAPKPFLLDKILINENNEYGKIICINDVEITGDIGCLNATLKSYGLSGTYLTLKDLTSKYTSLNTVEKENLVLKIQENLPVIVYNNRILLSLDDVKSIKLATKYDDELIDGVKVTKYLISKYDKEYYATFKQWDVYIFNPDNIDGLDNTSDLSDEILNDIKDGGAAA